MGRSKRLPTLSLDGQQQPCIPDVTGTAGQSLADQDSNSTAIQELTLTSLAALRQFFEILD